MTKVAFRFKCTKQSNNLERYIANVLTIKTTGLEIARPLQGKSALSMEKGCKNCGFSLQFPVPIVFMVKTFAL
jgi:hypothetical protein